MEPSITLTGNVGHDVDSFTGDGWQITRFRMASTPRIRRGDEWVDGETTWISVRTTGRLAEHVARSITKGDPVVVVGKLRTQSWVNQDQQRQDRLVVEASAVGHDLSRGTSTFTRRERPEQPVTEQPVTERGADEGKAAGEAGEGADHGSFEVDLETGEVREAVTVGG